MSDGEPTVFSAALASGPTVAVLASTGASTAWILAAGAASIGLGALALRLAHRHRTTR